MEHKTGDLPMNNSGFHFRANRKNRHLQRMKKIFSTKLIKLVPLLSGSEMIKKISPRRFYGSAIFQSFNL